ncbi:MAG: methionyl-tRNA formyltransferase, partial [Kiritimatiellia bacterium]
MNASPLKIIFLGSADISATVLEALSNTPDACLLATVTQPDRPAGRRRMLTPCDCRRRALELGLKTLVPENINAPEILATLRALKPDLIVVVAYGQFLGNELLSLPPLGCVNLHVSLLPAYRGASPIQTAILRGETVTGVTLMQMDPGMDTGPILATTSTPIAPEETAGELAARLAPLAARLLIDNLPPLANRTLRPHPQD